MVYITVTLAASYTCGLRVQCILNVLMNQAAVLILRLK